MRLVAGWYYPASYGRIDGALSDDEVHRLVASLEAEVLMVQAAPVNTDAPIVEAPPPRRELERCELCGFPLPPKSAQTRPT
jgi:hypothetical protein